jgi:TonB-dependent SusC/RagA subfamily outer membrane receptor
MTSFAMRALLSCGLIIGLSSGCAHRNNPAAGAPPPASTSPPSATVTADDIARAPGQSVEQVLMGRFPGVEVTRTPDGGFAVRIRGGSSIRSGNVPLYVLDGVAIDPGPNGYLTGVNPNDIASIQVLKEPAETALYGLRGANGVIVIETKRPDHP